MSKSSDLDRDDGVKSYEGLWDENGRDKYGSEGVIHTSGVGEEDNAIHPISLQIILKSDELKMIYYSLMIYSLRYTF